jgi:cation diffusion facilitator CzcD-associated flavoprotein CzcO
MSSVTEVPENVEQVDYDVVVVGAGMGGIYAVHRLRQQGLSVVCLEAAGGIGGVWYHNSYPGARVDIESSQYCYLFDEDLYRDWKWSERYAAQPEILGYLNHVADRFDVRRHIRLGSRVIAAVWSPTICRYAVRTHTGELFNARFLVMATGQLSKPRKPNFAGIDDFVGEWVQTSDWRDIQLDGKRIAVVGTGSSGMQTVTALAGKVEHLYVFQRTPHYAVPAHNGPTTEHRHARLATTVSNMWNEMLGSPKGIVFPPAAGKAGDFLPEQRRAILEERWAFGGQAMQGLFTDQNVDIESNTVVADFVRQKTRERIADPELAEKLLCYSYPFGVRRICVDTGYYESFNRDDVSLIDVQADPIERITENGIRLASGAEVEVEIIIFALGFNAFTGSLDEAGVANECGRRPSDNWVRGPRTYLGLMTTGFPNLFIITGPGSPSVLVNMNLGNVQHVDFVAELIEFMNERGYATVEASKDAEDAWTEYAASLAEPLLRRTYDNYLTHVNADDGSRVVIPFAGDLTTYIERCDEVVASGYKGFDFES